MGGSSSHRRKATPSQRRRFSPRLPSTPPATIQEVTFADMAITQGLGYDLLRKSGWEPGSPLGPCASSIPGTPTTPTTTASPGTPRTAPLSIHVKRGRAGLGATQTVITEAAFMPRSAPEQRSGRIGLERETENLRHVASCDVFDPLRPRCQFDSTHVVRNLKALRKHEMSCPKNPIRGRGGFVSPSPASLEETISPGTVQNLFSHLALSSEEEDMGYDSDESDYSVMSDLSDEDTVSIAAQVTFV